MRRTLYWKRLLIVVTALLMCGGATFALHRVQLRSQVTVYKEAAERAEAGIDGDPKKRGEVLDLYAKYLKFRPADEGAYQKFAALLFAQAQADPAAAPRAVAGVEGFLRAFPAHPEERRQLAEIYAKSGRHMNARQHIDMLISALDGTADDVATRELAADCDWALGKKPEAIAHLRKAIATKKAPVRVYKRALELTHQYTADPQRETNLSDLLRALREEERFRNDPEACIAAARFKLFLGWNDARANAEYALHTIPGGEENPDALFAMAEIEIAELKAASDATAKLKEIESLLRRARDRDPKNIAVGSLLCDILVRQGKRDEGLEVLRATAKLLDPKEYDYVMVADRLIDLGEAEDSGRMTDVIAADEARKAVVPYLRGRLAALKKDWSTALRLLEEARPSIARAPALNKKLLVALAACYAAVLNPDKQLEHCRAVLATEPDYPPAVVGEAEALAKLNRVGEALPRYRRIVNGYRLGEYRTELVRLELYHVLAQPGATGERNWDRFNEAVKPVPVAERPAEMQVLCSDALAAQGKTDQGAEELRLWIDKNPKSPKANAAFVALARLNTGGTAESALAVLEEAKTKFGDSVDLRLAQAGLLVARNRAPEPDKFKALADGPPGIARPDQFRLWYGLGQAVGRVADLQPDGAQAQGLREVALKLLRDAADLMPDDLGCRTVLLDNAIAAGRADLVKQALGEIETIEGGGGPYAAIGRIAVELPQVKKMTDKPARDAAAARLRELGRRAQVARPGWGRAYVALAELDYMQGLNDAALDNYRKAIDNGERQEFVIRRTIELFRVKKQDDLAVGVLNKLRTEIRLPDDLERYRAIRDLLAAPEVPRNSRATVDGIAPADSKDHRLQLLRGALLATIREDAGALTAFGRAVELNDRSPETWGSLVSQLVRTGDLPGAKQAVAQAEVKLATAPAATPEARAELRVALGGLHEMVGDRKAALEHFEAAVAAAPLDLNATRQLIQFHQRTGQSATADRLLAAAKDSPAQDTARWARRHLALTTIARPNAYVVRNEALALVERNLKDAPKDPEDLKARAVIWTVDPATRGAGIKVLKEHGDQGDLTPDECYLLGRLAFDVGEYAEAEDHFKRAARIRPGVTAEHIAALVRVQVALSPLGQLARAEATLDRLKINNPGSWEATREEARLLHRKSRDAATTADTVEAKKLIEKAREVLKSFKGWDEPDVIASRTGPLFEEIGLPDEAEALYKKVASGTAPDAHQPLAILYIRQKQPQQAIALAFERERKAPVLLTAQLLTGAVRTKRPDAATEAKVEKWLDEALAKSAADPELEAALIGAKAELADARGEYATAIREYERSAAKLARTRDPKGRKDVITNNLCMLLALHQPARADEAVNLMSELIAIRGPVPAFLDTRAVAYLVSSRPELAIKDLEMALTQYDRAAYHFHLAWAYDQNVLAVQRTRAVDEVDAARRLGLTADDLHAIEFKKYEQLQAKYPPRLK
ncbi:hypothetical protein R5W23_005337 [Gemmata sp. JC673]|uniref:Tetratricopeptide repeat protein n=1 Tax=Gemmata algarum TaxID=2975278 RepID=A0ABU5F7Z5_9BACT|nr:hypothetical protein [Gemmata algarum]MDY3563721.1 hypothetical protein [Gemmata algarum]